MQTVTYSVNYAGDFTTLASAFSGIGSDLTYSDSGHTSTGAGSSNTIVVDSGVTSACVGHTILWNGNRYWISSFNSGTHTATIAAKSIYPGSFSGTPGNTDPYSIDDVSVVLNIGASASGAGGNLWAVSSLSLSTITTGSSNTITISGILEPSLGEKLALNSSGSTIHPVCIKPSGGWTIAVNYVTLNNLQYWNAGNSALTVTGSHCTINNGFVQVDANSLSDFAILAVTDATSVFNNCVFYGSNTSSRPAAMDGVANGCLYYTNADIAVLGSNLTATDCAFYGYTGTNIYHGANNDGNFGMTPVRCAAQSSISSVGGITVITTPAFLSASSPVDFRIGPASGLLAAGGIRATTTDMFGETRSSSASTIGPSEQSYTPPGIENVTYLVAYNGDIINMAPTGAVSSLMWSGGVVTVTTSSAHGVTVGNAFRVSIQDVALTGSGYYGTFTATATGTSSFTYPLVSNPGSTPSSVLWHIEPLNTVLGNDSADLTYFSTNSCSGTAADTTHIVLSSRENAAVVGHPILWSGTSTKCMITAFDPSTFIATVSPIAGYAGDFGARPQNNDSYIIFPINVTFNIGQSAAGNTFWQLSIVNPNLAALSIGPAITSSSNAILVQGTAAFNPAVPLGTPQTSGSAICIKNGNGDPTSNHTAVFGIGCNNLTIQNLQLWCTGVNQESGCLAPVVTLTGPVLIKNINCYGENNTDDTDHKSWFGGDESLQLSGVTLVNSNFISTKFNILSLGAIPGGGNVAKNCTFLNTQSFVTTTVGTTSMGASTISIASASGLPTVGGAGNPGIYMIATGIAAGTFTTHVSGTTVTISGGSGVTQSIPSGTQIVFAPAYMMGGLGTGLVVENCAFFGATSITSGSFTSPSFIACATDSNPESLSGFTLMVYSAQFKSVYQTATTGATIDCRLASGSGLIGAGTFDAAVTTDIFGNARPNPPSIGAAEFIVTAVTKTYGFVAG